MSSIFKGVVISGAKSADANAETTNEAEAKVVRNFQSKADALSSFTQAFRDAQPDLVDICADVYRAHNLNEKDSVNEEYFVWSANSANLAINETKIISNADLNLSSRNLTIREGLADTYYDASNVIYIKDREGREIESVKDIIVAIGGVDVIGLNDTHFDFNPKSGRITLKNTVTTRNLTQSGANQAALSLARGDEIRSALYYIKGARFWWAKNTSDVNLFSWDNQKRTWSLLSGSAPQNLGQLTSQNMTLSPVPTHAQVNDFLDGGASNQYATLRLGDNPNETSLPISAEGLNDNYQGVLVVTKEDFESGAVGFDDYNPPLAGVVNIANGQILYNPAFVESFYGLNVWYSPLNFTKGNNGVVGVFGEDIYLSPPPPPQSHPMVQIGNRDSLQAFLVDVEVALNTLDLSEGQIGVALSTGKVRFSDEDLEKIDLESPAFNRSYINALVYYRGVALSVEPLPVKYPVNVKDEAGNPVVSLGRNTELRIPPTDLAQDGYFISGHLKVPDGTGTKPNASELPIFRPNKSGLLANYLSTGDAFIYNDLNCLERIKSVDRISDLPKRKEIKESSAYVSHEANAVGLKTRLPLSWQKENASKPLYFRQGEVVPCRSTSKRLVSKKRAPFNLRGGERLHFFLDGVYSPWLYNLGDDVVETLSLTLEGKVSVSLINRHLVIDVPDNVSLELSAYNEDSESDFSGLNAVGFSPYYNSTFSWSVDSGVSLGVYRSPVNLDLSRDINDFNVSRLVDDVTISTISASPFLFLDKTPLEDRLGYSEGVFFKSDNGVTQSELVPYEDVYYDFSEGRFKWVKRAIKRLEIDNPSVSVFLGEHGVLEGSTTEALDGYVKFSDGVSRAKTLTLDTDYVVDYPQGQLTLIEKYGSTLTTGVVSLDELGVVVTQDANLFSATEVGHLLKLSLDNGVTYARVEEKISNTSVKTNFSGVLNNVLCATLAFDEGKNNTLLEALYKPFDHLSESPLVVRRLTPVSNNSQANVFEALTLGRDYYVRIDGVDLDTSTLNLGVSLGYSNNTLKMPSLSPSKEEREEVYLVCNGTTFSAEQGTLSRVAEFTDNPDLIEYLPSGEIRIGNNISSTLSEGVVYYYEIFSSTESQVEINPHTGDVSFGSIEASNEDYLVEVLIPNTDYKANPLAGSFQLSKPLVLGQQIEVTYRPADIEGQPTSDTKTTKKLPFIIKNEVAVRKGAKVFTYNAQNAVRDESFEPIVYVQANLENYDGAETATISNQKITFKRDIPSEREVKITYATYSSQSGELMFTLGEGFYQQPFFLEEGQDTFVLTGERPDVAEGCLLRLGATCLYISTNTYDPTTGETTIKVTPTPTKELGSRAPNSNDLKLITDRPIKDTLTQDFGSVFNVGFVPMSPVSRGAKEITLFGNFTEYAISGNILEIGGDPFTIASAIVSNDGNQTIIQLTDIVQKGYSSSDTLKISKTPIYEQTTNFLVGKGAFLESHGYELILLNSQGIGSPLRKDKDYVVNPLTGDITFDSNNFNGLNEGDEVLAVLSLIKNVSPYYKNNALVKPYFLFKYRYLTNPTQAGLGLKGYYEYRNVDSFFFKVKGFSAYASDVLQKEYLKNNVTSGSFITTTPNEDNDQGVSGVLATRTDIKNLERVARGFLSFYHNTITPLEQMLETSEGVVIGDRDGKFRFNIQREDRVTETPGFEDSFSGEYTPRILWRDSFLAVSPSEYTPISTDPLIRPHLTPFLSDGVLWSNDDSFKMTSSEIKRLSSDQLKFIQNEIDDILLVGVRKTSKTIQNKKYSYTRGLFKRLGEPHTFSRLFPQRTKGYGQILDGHVSEEYPSHGIFTAGRLVETGEGVFDYGWADTNGDVIGQLQNNVIGEISSTSEATLTKRHPRARIVRYSPIGFPELDTLLGLVGAERFSQTPRPAVIATPLLVKEFPLDQNNLPEISLLSANGGDLADLTTGDTELSVPPFYEGLAVNLGYSDGSLATLRDQSLSLVRSEPVNAQPLVRNIYKGCVMDFKSNVSDPVENLIDTSEIRALEEIALEGDTIFAVSTQPDQDAGIAPTLSEIAIASSFTDTFRSGSDFTLKSNGQLIDRTLPSINDSVPFPLKEMLGQTPPSAGMFYDADISFNYSEISPLRIPALFSEDKSDSGDYQTPYLSASSVEKVRLRSLQNKFANILNSDNLFVLGSRYPDEIIQRNATPNDLGELEFDRSLTPIADEGSYTPYSGIGDVKPYDLILSETLEGSDLGCRGFLSVGAVSSNLIEPPRFITHTALGNQIKYRLNNAVVYEDSLHLSGTTLSKTFNSTLNTFVYRFEVGSIGGLDLTSFEDFWVNAERDTQVDIKLYKREIDPYAGANEGEVIDTIKLIKTGAVGSVGGTAQRFSSNGNISSLFTLVYGSLSFRGDLVIITSIVGTPLINENYYNHVTTSATDFYVSNAEGNVGYLDFSVDVFGISRTANIEEDRLSFTEVYPLSHAGERGYAHPASGLSLEAQLDIISIETGLLGNPESIVNSTLEINGGTPLTFLRRDITNLGVGLFDSDTNRWALRAHGWEGHGNTPLKGVLEGLGEQLNVSAIPSSEPVISGIAMAEEANQPNGQLILKEITTTLGAMTALEKSDLIKITESVMPAYPCTTKAGTYLIRGHVPADAGLDYGSFSNTYPVSFEYPKLKEITEEAGVYTLHMTKSFSELINGLSMYPLTNGRVHIITDFLNFYSGIARDLQFTVICADYSRRTGDAFTGLSNFRDALGNVITPQDFMSLANNARGSFLSGMSKLSLNFEYSDGFVPQGYHDPANSMYGVVDFKINSLFSAQSLDFSVGRVVDNTGGSFGTASGKVFVSPYANVLLESYRESFSGPYYYNNTPNYLDLSYISDAQWYELNNPRGVALTNPAESALRCITPYNNFEASFRATAGIYIEPTMPTPVQNLGASQTPRVVDEQNPNDPVNPNLRLGFRGLLDYVPTAVANQKEYVKFEISHIRRFHEVNNTIKADASELSYIYEMRKANSITFSPDPVNGLKTIFTSTGGTQLGPFTFAKVNVNAGDELKVKRAGEVVFRSRIKKVESETLYLEVDWELDDDHSQDEAFIMLKQTPVPHEQSCEELLEAITDVVRVNAVANLNNNKGGYTPWRTDYAGSVNILSDTRTQDPNQIDYLNYINEGVSVGDILIVDPAGDLKLDDEKGSRPFGDLGVEGRTDGLGNPIYEKGAPSLLDDNRGFYLVTNVTSTEVSVTCFSSLVGNISTGDVILEDGDNTKAFAIYPTVNNSPLTTGGYEGQMDLRPTEFADPNTGSFKLNNLSVAPYSYKIIKPTGLLSTNTIGQMLLIRERTLSFIEQIKALYSKKKYGTYRDFQVESHAQDVGSNLDPTIGLGVALNVLITDLRGRVEVAPFSNDSDGLSILDRRVFIEDTYLDTQKPRGSVINYTDFENDYNQPSLLTRISELLNQGDALLESRYSWIDFRVNRKDGSFQRLLRYDTFELPRRIEETNLRARRLAIKLEE